MYYYGPPHMAGQKQDDQLEHTFSSSVRLRDVALKTYQRRWTIGRSGERGSGISVPAARHDDDDDIYICMYCQRILGSLIFKRVIPHLFARINVLEHWYLIPTFFEILIVIKYYLCIQTNSFKYYYLILRILFKFNNLFPHI